MLNPSSKLKGEKDMMKYEKARMLKAKIDDIRTNYMDVSFLFFTRILRYKAVYIDNKQNYLFCTLKLLVK